MFVAPANQDCTVTAALGKLTLDQQLVVVGKKTFVDSGSGLEPGKASDFDFAEFCPSNKDFWAGFAVKPPKGVTPTKEVQQRDRDPALRRGQRRERAVGVQRLGDLPADVTRLRAPALVRGAWRVPRGGATPAEQHVERVVRVAHRRVAGAAAGAVHGQRELRPVARQRQDTRGHRAEERSSTRASDLVQRARVRRAATDGSAQQRCAVARAVRARLALRREIAGV